MDGWEIDIELRVRKTLHFAGPTTEAGAREIAELALAGKLDLYTLAKWESDHGGFGRHPVEELAYLADPRLIAIRRVER